MSINIFYLIGAPCAKFLLLSFTAQKGRFET